MYQVKAGELFLKVFLIYVLIMLVAACATSTDSSINIVQNRAVGEIERAITMEDYGTVSLRLIGLLNHDRTSAPAQQALSSIEQIPGHQDKIFTAYKDHLKALETDLSIERYERLVRGVTTLYRADIVSKEHKETLDSTAAEIITKGIKKLNAQSLDRIVRSSYISDAIKESTREYYGAALRRSLDQDLDWAAENGKKFSKFGLEDLYKEALVEAAYKDPSWAKKNKETYLAVGLGTQYALALVDKLKANSQWAKENRNEYVRIVDEGLLTEESLKTLGEHIDLIGLPYRTQRALAGEFPEQFGDTPAILISHIGIRGPNSAAGVDARISFTPLSQKTIKYIRFWAIPYNRVGDTVRSTVDRQSEKTLVKTGPHSAAGSNATGTWETVWYNPTIACIELRKVEVLFMDETRETYAGDNLEAAIYNSVNNDCSYKSQ